MAYAPPIPILGRYVSYQNEGGGSTSSPDLSQTSYLSMIGYNPTLRNNSLPACILSPLNRYKSHKQQFQTTSHPFHHGLIFCQGLFHFCKDLYPSALRLPNCHRLKLYTALNYESEEVAAIYPYSKPHFLPFYV